MQTRSSSFRVGKRRRDPGKEAGFNVVVVVDLVSLPRAFVLLLLLFFLSRQPPFFFNFSLLKKITLFGHCIIFVARVSARLLLL